MTPAQEERRKCAFTAVLLTCLTYFCFSLSDVCLKMMAKRFHWSEVVLIPAAITVAVLSVYMLATRHKGDRTTRKPFMMMTRAGLSQVVAFCNISALPHITMSMFYSLVFTSPFWVALMTAVFFKDRLTRLRAAVIAAGFGVVLFVFKPGGANFYALLVLAGAFFYSLQLMLMRQLGRGESRVFMIFCGALTTLAVFGSTAARHFVMPQPWEWAVFVVSTLINMTGLFSISYAFQTAPSPSALAPYHYTQMAYGVILGWLVFHEVPQLRVILGAAAIIMMGLYLIWSETRQSRVPDAETTTDP